VAEPRPERDQLPLPERPDTTVRWLEAVTAADLAAAAPAPATGWLWAAGERGLAKSARAFARAAGWPRERQHVQTYWVARA
jgi:NADPH-dependent ferric siderophore reductase